MIVQMYVDLIRNEVINPKTGEPWKVEDVPTKWRAAVEKALG